MHRRWVPQSKCNSCPTLDAINLDAVESETEVVVIVSEAAAAWNTGRSPALFIDGPPVSYADPKGFAEANLWHFQLTWQPARHRGASRTWDQLETEPATHLTMLLEETGSPLSGDRATSA